MNFGDYKLSIKKTLHLRQAIKRIFSKSTAENSLKYIYIKDHQYIPFFLFRHSRLLIPSVNRSESNISVFSPTIGLLLHFTGLGFRNPLFFCFLSSHQWLFIIEERPNFSLALLCHFLLKAFLPTVFLRHILLFGTLLLLYIAKLFHFGDFPISV